MGRGPRPSVTVGRRWCSRRSSRRSSGRQHHTSIQTAPSLHTHLHRNRPERRDYRRSTACCHSATPAANPRDEAIGPRRKGERRLLLGVPPRPRAIDHPHRLPPPIREALGRGTLELDVVAVAAVAVDPGEDPRLPRVVADVAVVVVVAIPALRAHAADPAALLRVPVREVVVERDHERRHRLALHPHVVAVAPVAVEAADRLARVRAQAPGSAILLRDPVVPPHGGHHGRRRKQGEDE